MPHKQTCESWLWHRRLGHLNFDHIISLSKKNAVRDMPVIKKPSNTICKSCQLGKQTCISFKTKEKLSTSRPLQLVHMDLCEPSRTNAPSGESYFMLIVEPQICAFLHLILPHFSLVHFLFEPN